MSHLSRPLLISCALVACLLVGITATVIHLGPDHPATAASQPASRLAGTVVWPSGTRPAPAFALHDQSGQLISRAGLRGHVWAMTFLDSHCAEACPVEAHALAVVQRQLGARTPLKIIVVSVLPRYDTPQRVRYFAHKSGLSGDWHWLLGTPQKLAPVWGEYGIEVQSGVTHTAAVYLVDQHGDVRIADAVPFVPDQLASSVRALYKQNAVGT